MAAMLRADFKYVKVGEWEQYEKFSDPIIERVAKFENADESIPIAIIALKEPLPVRDNLARFDFGICMAGWRADRFLRRPSSGMTSTRRRSRCTARTIRHSPPTRWNGTGSLRRTVTPAGSCRAGSLQGSGEGR